MPAKPLLRACLEDMGIYDDTLTEQQLQLRYARFQEVTFGVAPPHRWNGMRRQLLKLENQLAATQADVGLVQKQFHLQLAKEPEFFHRPASLPPKQREWVKQEMNRLEAAGVVKRVQACKVASRVVLVDQGQSGQDYRLCIDFTDLNAYTQPIHYPMQDSRQFIDQCAGYTLFTLGDVKACFHNIAVAPDSQPYLGVVTQDGLFVCTRLPFGLHAAPATAQCQMDEILAPFPSATAFIDDIVIRGHLEEWEALWDLSLQVLGALAEAGFMLNLRKTKFLEPVTDILGLRVSGHGYHLGDKCLKGWSDVKIPRSLLELQTILGRLVWASPFIPNYKSVVAPLEALLSRKSAGTWEPKHTDALNQLLQEVYTRVNLQFPLPDQPFHLYPAHTEDLKTAVLTQEVTAQPKTIALIAARMSLTEKKKAPVEKLLLTTTWAVRMLKRYVLFAPYTIVYLPLPEHITLIRDRAVHMRIRAYLLDLQAYNIRWEVGSHLLAPQGELLDYKGLLTTSPEAATDPPAVEHEDVVLDYGATTRRKVSELKGSAYWTLWFDGGASRGLGTGGYVIYDEQGDMRVAMAVWFGDLKRTVNQAEMGALLSGLEWLQGQGQVTQVMVRGDSKLTIDFFNNAARPSNTELFLGLKEGRKKLSGKRAAFRHHPREENQLADWLTRVARTHQATLDLTSACATLLPSQVPPILPTANRSELLAGVGRGATGVGARQTAGQLRKKGPTRKTGVIRGGVAKRTAIKNHKIAPVDANRCKVCGYRDFEVPRCWGCGEHYHPGCLGVTKFELGPFYCPSCRHDYSAAGNRDITLQIDVMHLVATGQLPKLADEAEIPRIERAAKAYRWKDGELWITTREADMRKVPPLRDRKGIVEDVARSLAYPGGSRLYHLLSSTYYWPGMRQQVGLWCSQHYPNYAEGLRWKPPPFLVPHHKSHQPFHTWAVDLITRLTPPGKNGETTLIVGVDVFTKYVEAAPLASKSSLDTARWLYSNIFCRYGIPALIRCDLGTEFKGDFQSLCKQFGVTIAPVCRANPRANGQVERYNGALRAGFRRMATASGTPWFEALPTILASLRFLPTYLGYSPHLATYKQEPHWISSPDHHPVSLHVSDHSPEAMEKLIDDMAAWWDQTLGVLRGRLAAKDDEMTRRYMARKDLEDMEIWVDLQPGDKVVIRTALPGKMQPRLEGPCTFLRHVGVNGLAGEVLMADGSTRREALTNLRLYQAGVTAEPKVDDMVIWGPTLGEASMDGESNVDDYLSSDSEEF